MPETNHSAFQLSPRAGDVLRGDIWHPAVESGELGRAIVICHGFKGFKDWGFFPFASAWLAEALACPVVSFNFSGSGVGPDLENFTEPEKFGRNTFSREVEDLAAVLNGIGSGRLGELEVRGVHRIGVLGHSRGGVAAILSGERDDVQGVVTWAAIASVDRYVSVFDGLAPDEAAPVRNARTGQVLPLYRDVLYDIRAHPGRFDLRASLLRSEVPLLVVHGTEDESVPLEDGRWIADPPSARFAAIEGAGHTFDVVHPFGGPTEELLRALELSRDHFVTHL